MHSMSICSVIRQLDVGLEHYRPSNVLPYSGMCVPIRSTKKVEQVPRTLL